MPLRFLLDTNILSEPLRPFPDPAILENLRRAETEAALPSMVWHELLFGCQRLPTSKRRQAIERYLLEVVRVSFPILPYDEDAAAWHALERARLVTRGQTPPFLDGQIAAVAATRSLTLVTLNRKDFDAFLGITLTDWRNTSRAP
jgi:tRNA(fMet)-specific endonuclease VapC